MISFLFQYGFDFFKMRWVTEENLEKFMKIYQILDVEKVGFERSDLLWKAIDLEDLTHITCQVVFYLFI